MVLCSTTNLFWSHVNEWGLKFTVLIIKKTIYSCKCIKMTAYHIKWGLLRRNGAVKKSECFKTTYLDTTSDNKLRTRIISKCCIDCNVMYCILKWHAIHFS